jgi:hypothetical protein
MQKLDVIIPMAAIHGFLCEAMALSTRLRSSIKGYVYGFCSNPELAGGGGSDAEQADITCDDGPNGVRWAEPGSLDDNNTTFWTPK